MDLDRTHHHEVVEMENCIAAIQTDIDEFIAMVRPLVEDHGFAAEWSDYPRVAGVADDIIGLHRDVTEAARIRADAEKKLEDAQQDLEARQKGRQEVADLIDALLKSGGTEDADDFRQRGQVFQERSGLSAAISSSVEPDAAHRRAGRGAGHTGQNRRPIHPRRHPAVQDEAGGDRRAPVWS